MTLDWEDPKLLTCPAASTASMAIICDSHRSMMVREGKRLTAELKLSEHWRLKWSEDVRVLSQRLIEALGERR